MAIIAMVVAIFVATCIFGDASRANRITVLVMDGHSFIFLFSLLIYKLL